MSGHQNMSAAELQAWWHAKQQLRTWRPTRADMELLQNVMGMATQAPCDTTLSADPARVTPSNGSLVRNGAAFANVSSATIDPANAFARETYDSLLKYSEAVAAGYIAPRLKNADLPANQGGG